jgi:nucleoside-diphosphate-sugar epimerase
MHHDAQPKIALVTGATGFIGSHLTRELLLDGWTVHVVTRPSSRLDELEAALERISVHPHDGSTEGLFGIIAAARPQVVFHLASLFLPQHTPNDVVPLIQSNVLFGTQLVEAMTAHKVHYLVNTGSFTQHYEDRAYSPAGLYAATKQAFEDILQYYAEATPLRAITLQLFDTYGPGDPRPKLFNLLREAAQRGQPLAMSPGEQLLEPVYIDDVVAGFVQAASLLLTNEVAGHESYSVGTGQRYTLREIVTMFQDQLGTSIPVRWGGRSYRSREMMVPWGGGKRLPNWKARVELPEGLRRMALAAEGASAPTGKAEPTPTSVLRLVTIADRETLARD